MLNYVKISLHFVCIPPLFRRVLPLNIKHSWVLFSSPNSSPFNAKHHPGLEQQWMTPLPLKLRTLLRVTSSNKRSAKNIYYAHIQSKTLVANDTPRNDCDIMRNISSSAPPWKMNWLPLLLFHVHSIPLLFQPSWWPAERITGGQ